MLLRLRKVVVDKLQTFEPVVVHRHEKVKPSVLANHFWLVTCQQQQLALEAF